MNIKLKTMLNFLQSKIKPSKILTTEIQISCISCSAINLYRPVPINQAIVVIEEYMKEDFNVKRKQNWLWETSTMCAHVSVCECMWVLFFYKYLIWELFNSSATYFYIMIFFRILTQRFEEKIIALSFGFNVLL